MNVRLFILLFFCINSLTVQAQKKPFVLQVQSYVDGHNDRPFNLVAVNDLSGTNGIVGRAHVGMLNKQRDIVIQYGTEVGLLNMGKASMGVMPETAPKATLNLLHLAMSETILMTKETGRIEMAATQTVETPQGPRHYGPAQFQLTKGSLDATAQHGKRLLMAYESIMDDLTDDYLNERDIPAPTPEYRPLEGDIPNGAYRTLLDFQLAQTDPTLQLMLKSARPIDVYDGVEVSQVSFARTGDTKRKELGRLFGYHFDGKSYLLVKGRFDQVVRTPDGEIMATLPRDLYRTVNENQALGYGIGGFIGGAIASSGNDNPNDLLRYTFDSASGKFNKQQEVFSGPINTGLYLVNTGASDAEPISIMTEQRKFVLHPGEAVLFSESVTIQYVSDDALVNKTLPFDPLQGNRVYSIAGKKDKVKVKMASEKEQAALLENIRIID